MGIIFIDLHPHEGVDPLKKFLTKVAQQPQPLWVQSDLRYDLR